MPDCEPKPTKSASEEILTQVEENLAPGSTRDLWWQVRSELAESGPEAVRTYLQSEYQVRHNIVKNALEELSNQLEETR